jgi:HTH-type transcriptional regulator, competence development regulator
MPYFLDADVDLSGFGARIRAARMLKGWTQSGLASACGGCIQKGHISKWESGKNTPSCQYVLVLAQALGCSTDFLLGHRAANPDPTEKELKGVLNRDMRNP